MSPDREKKWSALAGNINLRLSETMRRGYRWTWRGSPTRPIVRPRVDTRIALSFSLSVHIPCPFAAAFPVFVSWKPVPKPRGEKSTAINFGVPIKSTWGLREKCLPRAACTDDGRKIGALGDDASMHTLCQGKYSRLSSRPETSSIGYLLWSFFDLFLFYPLYIYISVLNWNYQLERPRRRSAILKFTFRAQFHPCLAFLTPIPASV